MAAKKASKRKSGRKFLLVGKDTPFQYQEAFKSLRTNLKFLAVGKACKKIIMTSAIPGEGKSSVAINLAVSLAETGSRVLLVDCDLRKPIIHRYLKIDNSAYKGITNVLSDGSLAESIVGIKALNIHVIIADAIPPNPAELLGSSRMKMLISELDKHYDVDGVILVVRQNFATFDQVALAKKNLDSVDANILGVVMNNFDTRSANKESGYYYSYNYDYSHSED